MKYMSFNSSCSYCCLANLLEGYGVDREDRELALDMDLPWLFSYDPEGRTFLAGAMLQGKAWFDRNPHRRADGEPDRLSFTDEALLAAREAQNAVGCLRRMERPRPAYRRDLEASLNCLEAYRRAVTDFCGRERTEQEIREAVNPLFRPLAVDALAMMELAGEGALADTLREFQRQAMALFRAGACLPAELIDLELFARAVDGLRAGVERRLARQG